MSFFRVPRVIVNQGEYAEDLSTERRRWISATSRDDLTDAILENDRVCSTHFVSGQAAKDWDRFNVDWIPTMHLGHSKQQTNDSEGAVARSQRAAERRKRRAEAVDKEIEGKLKKNNEPGDTVSEIFSVAEAVNAADLDLEKDQKKTSTNRKNNTLDVGTQTQESSVETKNAATQTTEFEYLFKVTAVVEGPRFPFLEHPFTQNEQPE